MTALVIIAILVGTRLTGLLDAYKYLFVFWGGISFVLIARWYWWRVNVWSEIVTLVTAAIVGNLLFILLPDQPGEGLVCRQDAGEFHSDDNSMYCRYIPDDAGRPPRYKQLNSINACV